MFLSLGAGFAASGYAVDLVVADASGPLRSSVPEGVRLIDLHCRRVLATTLPLVRYLRSERPEFLVSGQDHANVVAILANIVARCRVAVVVTAHSPFRSNSEGRAGFTGVFLPLAVRLTYPRAEAVIAVSDNVAADLIALVPQLRDTVLTIPNPTIPPNLAALLDQPTGIAWLDHPDGVPTLLAVGRLDPVKDHKTLLRAIARVRAARPVRLVIVGDGEQRAELRRLARDLNIQDALCFAGDIANPFPFYARADITCISSRFEAGPMVLIESIASGVPVVSTNCSALARSMLSDGGSGTVVPVGDSTAMAAAIEGRLLHPTPVIMSGDRLAPFQTETAVSGYLRVLESIALRGRHC